MALKATIHKAAINIADMDRNFFQDINLTIAQHPSETDQRMMLRLLAWICHADERLLFTKGLSADDEPEVGAIMTTTALSCGLNWGYLKRNGCAKPVINQNKSFCMHTVSVRPKSGGHKFRRNSLGIVT